MKNIAHFIAVIASMVMAAFSHAATIITTDGFNTGTIAETPWNGTGTATAGQWFLNETTPSGTTGRLTVGNPYGYPGQATPQEGSGQAQFSNGINASFTATLTDTAGHFFNVGDQVSIDFFTAGRTAGAGAVGITVSLVGAAALPYGGVYRPTHNSTTWEAMTTGYVTIVTAGIYNVQFANVLEGTDRTTYLDSVSYSVIPIPEPSAAILVGLVGLGMLLRRRR